MLCAPVLAGAAANYPFPQNRAQPFAHTYPAYLNSDVQFVYQEFLNRQVTAAGAGGYRRVQRNGDVTLQANSTVSEGIAYGMIIAVYMNDQALFDDLWRYYNLHLDGNGLMHWYISADGNTVLGSGAATDADQDVAWALCMAHYQWGTSTVLTPAAYLTHATTIIDRIWNTEVEKPSMVLKPGDGWGGSGTTNVSYFDPSMYRVFAQVSGQNGWLQVVDVCYTALNNSLQAGYGNLNNGLVPAWSTLAGGLVGGQPQNFQYDSCRTPFRIAKDWYFFGEPRALAYLNKINSFYVPKGAANILDGYALNGADQPQYDSAANTLSSAAFLAPAMVGSMASAAVTNTAFVQAAYDRLKTNLHLIGGPYYDQSWTVMGLLFASGNYLKYPLPTATVTPTRTASPFGSPTVSPTRSLTFTISPTRTPSATASPTPTPTGTLTPLPCGVNVVQRRMVASGTAYTDGASNLWSAEQAYAAGGWGYVNGTQAGVGNAISGTTDDPLYNAQRYGDPLEYRFTVPNGFYQVRLKMAETYFSSAGARVFNVLAEGATVASGIDIFARVGANAALDLTFTVAVADGVLNVVGDASVDSARFGAIEVTQLFGGTCAPSATASPSGTRTRTPSATLTGSPSMTLSATPSRSPTVTLSWSPSASSTRSPTPSATPLASLTPSPTLSPVLSATPTVTATVTPSRSPSATLTSSATPTSSWSPSASATRSPSSTATLTGSASPTLSRTETPSASPSLTPSHSPSATASMTGTVTGTATPSFSPVPTGSSATPTPTASQTWTVSPTVTLSMTPTLSASATVTGSPTLSASPSLTLSPTGTLTATQTLSASATQTLSATPTWSPSPSASPTASPSLTASPTLSPTGTASPTLTLSATPSLTATASPSLTGTRTSSPTASATPSSSVTASRTATMTATGSWTPSPTASPTLTPVLAASATVTLPPSGGPPEILDQGLAPRPWNGQGSLWVHVKLSAPAEAVEWRLYTKALNLVKKGSSPALPQAWGRFDLAPDLQGLSQGLYYVELTALGGGQRSRAKAPLKLYLLR